LIPYAASSRVRKLKTPLSFSKDNSPFPSTPVDPQPKKLQDAFQQDFLQSLQIEEEPIGSKGNLFEEVPEVQVENLM
jgi:hypothetical protein